MFNLLTHFHDGDNGDGDDDNDNDNNNNSKHLPNQALAYMHFVIYLTFMDNNSVR